MVKLILKMFLLATLVFVAVLINVLWTLDAALKCYDQNDNAALHPTTIIPAAGSGVLLYPRNRKLFTDTILDCLQDPKCHLMYHHIPKTAGTYISSVLYPIFDNDTYRSSPWCCHGVLMDRFYNDTDHFCERQKMSIYETHGNLYLEALETCEKSYSAKGHRYVGLVSTREPIQKTLSLIHQQCNHGYAEKNPRYQSFCRNCTYDESSPDAISFWYEHFINDTNTAYRTLNDYLSKRRIAATKYYGDKNQKSFENSSPILVVDNQMINDFMKSLDEGMKERNLPMTIRPGLKNAEEHPICNFAMTSHMFKLLGPSNKIFLDIWSDEFGLSDHSPSKASIDRRTLKLPTLTVTKKMTRASSSSNGSCCYHQSLAELDDILTLEYFNQITEKSGESWTGRDYENVWRTLRDSMLVRNRPTSHCDTEWIKVVLKSNNAAGGLKYLRFLNGTSSENLFPYLEESARLPRILYLGDSISLHTVPWTREIYGSGPNRRATIHGPPANCGSVVEYDEKLDYWLGQCPWDLIQFNIGAHYHPENYGGFEPYEHGLERAIKRLLEHSPKAKIVLALTTPSPFDSPETAPASRKTCKHYDKLFKAGTVPALNAVAKKVASRYPQVIINDRYNAVYPDLRRYQRPCNIHFKDEGYKRLAQQDWEVASMALGLLQLTTAADAHHSETSSVMTFFPDVTTPSTPSIPSSSWSDIRERLCPAGIPNLKFAGVLFSIARDRLGVDESEYLEVQVANKNEGHPMVGAIPKRFFNGPFQNATILTSDVGSIVYLPIWKAANMEIRSWMHKALNGRVSGGTVMDSQLEDFLDSDSAERAPLCVVSAIRDPIGHFLSGYNEIEFRLLEQIERNNRELLASAGPKFRFYHMPKDSKSDRMLRFTQFVYDIILEHASYPPGTMLMHVFSMTRILPYLHRASGRQLHLTAYLPTLNNLSIAFPELVAKSCASVLPKEFGPTLLPEVGMNRHRSSRDDGGFYQAAKDVWAKGANSSTPIAQALCALHAMDYACWKDLPEGIPKVCKEVYDSHTFVERIL